MDDATYRTLAQDRRSDADSHEDPRIFEAVELYLAACQMGESPDLDDFLQQYADVAEPVRNCVEGLAFLQRTGRSIQESSQPITNFVLGNRPITECLGDFQLVREIGRGGMGVVYEAEQISLRRKVALKVLPFGGLLNQRALTRFQNEARAAATLIHPHIVPVHAVGEDRGMYFYAMQLIRGASLAEVLRSMREIGAEQPGGGIGTSATTPRLDSANSEMASADDGPNPSWVDKIPVRVAPSAETVAIAALSTQLATEPGGYFRRVAEIGERIAQALHHAHLHGILHRDVKPGNILIDEAGHPWITDFGLAQIPGEATITMTGDLLGTLRYMSPEQAAGITGVLDERTDIYSLGVTLYELLCLRPAVTDGTRNQMLQQIALDEPTPLRRVNPAIPLDLATIVLRCMAKDPPDRYRTGQEVAADLRRFLDDRPIQSRRPTLWDRVVRWSRRHAAIVATATVSLVVVSMASILATGIVSWALRAKAKETERADERARAAEQALARADEQTRLARSVVDEMYTKVAQAWLPNPSQLTKVQREFLAKAADYYEQLATEHADDPEVLHQLSKSLNRVSAVKFALGDRAAARSYLDRALEISAQLVARYPENNDYANSHAAGMLSLGLLCQLKGESEESDRAYHTAIAIWERLVLSDGTNTAFRQNLATAYQNLGGSRMGEPGSEDHLKSAIQIYNSLAREFPDEAGYRIDGARPALNLAGALRKHHRDDEALEVVEAALELLAPLKGQVGIDPEARFLLGGALQIKAHLLSKMTRTDDAVACMTEAQEALESLVRDYGDQDEYQRMLATVNRELKLATGSAPMP